LEVTSRRTLLKISSGRKLCGSIHVPASIPATFIPARHNGSTATPPAAPSPITATSTGLRLTAMIASVCRSSIRFGTRLQRLIFRRDGAGRAGIANQAPPREARVPAVVRIGEHAFESQASNAREHGASVRESRGLARVHRVQNLVALFG